jgi:hypothetical protein
MYKCHICSIEIEMDNTSIYENQPQKIESGMGMVTLFILQFFLKVHWNRS